MTESTARGFLGPVLDAPERGSLRHRRNALVVVDDDGVISNVLETTDSEYVSKRQELEAGGILTVLPSAALLVPGFIDLHVHAPQWPQLGKALDVPLEVWLHQYTFPLEARYSDLAFAGEVYRSLVNAMLANGTTTAVYFGTIHLAATQLLADECLRRGQRALVGKVAMDHPEGCPDYYRDATAADGVSGSQRLIEYIRTHQDNSADLVQPIVTPRFVPSCTDAMLAALGELAEAEDCLVQTHCSESDWAHGYGLDRYGRTDTATYEAFGLLRRGTVLAHSNFITDSDMALIADTGAAVAHCPLSNAYFANAVFPTRSALDSGVHVGLGTDISGGPSASLLRTAALAVAVSRMLEDGVDPQRPATERGVPNSRITFAEAFWLATTAGGQALNMPIGLIEPGYRFDAVLIDDSDGDSDLIRWPEKSIDDRLQAILHNAGRADISTVWVDGKLVSGTADFTTQA